VALGRRIGPVLARPAHRSSTRPKSLHNSDSADSASPLLKRHHTATCDTVGHSPAFFFEKSVIAAWTGVDGVHAMDSADIVKAYLSAVFRGGTPQRIGATAYRSGTAASSSFAAARSNPAQRIDSVTRRDRTEGRRESTDPGSVEKQIELDPAGRPIGGARRQRPRSGERGYTEKADTDKNTHRHPPEKTAQLDGFFERSDNLGMEVTGRVQNGVVVLDDGASLPEGAVVTVRLRSNPTIRVARNQSRVEFPLVRSSKPASVDLTNEQIQKALDEEEIEATKRSGGVSS